MRPNSYVIICFISGVILTGMLFSCNEKTDELTYSLSGTVTNVPLKLGRF
jgi:hypothetical protein